MRALVSLSDKRGIESLAPVLAGAGWQLISTGGTASLLRGLGLETTEVSDLTGFPECMGGRLKHCTPKCTAAFSPVFPQTKPPCSDRCMVPIELVIANFYPFAEALAKQFLNRSRLH